MSLEDLQKENEQLAARLAELQAQWAKKQGEAEQQQAADEAENSLVLSLFEKYDADGSGFVDRDEFGFLAFDLGMFLSDEELSEAIAAIDTSGDGQISKDEFIAWYKGANDSGVGKKSGTNAMAIAAKMKLKYVQKKLSEAGDKAKKAANANAKKEIVQEKADAQEEEGSAAGANNLVHDAIKFSLGDVSGPQTTLSIETTYMAPEQAQEKIESLLGEGAATAAVIDLPISAAADTTELEAMIEQLNAALAQFKEPVGIGATIKITTNDAGAKVMRILASFIMDPSAELTAMFGLTLNDVLSKQTLKVSMPGPLSRLLTDDSVVVGDLFHAKIEGESVWKRELSRFLTSLAIGGVGEMLGSGATEMLTGFANLTKFSGGSKIELALGDLAKVWKQMLPPDAGDDIEFSQFLKTKVASAFKGIVTGFMAVAYCQMFQPEASASFGVTSPRKLYKLVQESVLGVSAITIVTASGVNVEIALDGADFVPVLPSVPEILQFALGELSADSEEYAAFAQAALEDSNTFLPEPFVYNPDA